MLHTKFTFLILFLGQAVHDRLVEHHFVTHIDRRTEHLQGAFYDLDSPVDTGAKPAWVRKNDLHGHLRQIAG